MLGVAEKVAISRMSKPAMARNLFELSNGSIIASPNAPRKVFEDLYEELKRRQEMEKADEI